MFGNSIHIVYHPTFGGYSGYSRELDGLHAEAKTVQELFSKIKFLISLRVKTLLEIGRVKDAEDLEAREVIFLEV